MKALIVDDNEGIRTLLRLLMESKGVEVAVAREGDEALLLLEAESPDVIILDIQMPAVDGWETLQRIRSHPTASRTPVVLCSVRNSAEDIANGWALGADAYISKPFDVEELVELVSTVSNLNDEERKLRRVRGLREAQRLMPDSN